MNEDKRLKNTNPKERGFVLPIGVFDGKTLKRDFSLREMGYSIERAIGKFKSENENLPNTAVVSRLVSLMLSTLGGEEIDFKPGDDPQKEADSLIKISQLFFADVYYIYIMARIQELGKGYDVGFACPSCGYSGKMETDLETMDVVCVNEPSILHREVSLVKGIKYRDGTIKKTLKLQPMIWANMIGNDVKEAGGDPTLVKLHFIKHCVIGVEGIDEMVVLGQSELETLRKIDIELVANAINAVNIGPSLIAKGKCPTCSEPFIWPIDWDYDAFFTIASP